MTDSIEPIRDDEQHAAALAELSRLWNAKDGTPEGDRLEVLMTLVDAYERARWPSGKSGTKLTRASLHLPKKPD